ncbi:hypothetical protein LV779_34690 [Streptomyces thinghirensis]|nr:hypothetical protein [Streptomyces thinghirensis]
MCSSSLTAVELACRDLRGGRTRLAFAGGVNVTVREQVPGSEHRPVHLQPGPLRELRRRRRRLHATRRGASASSCSKPCATPSATATTSTASSKGSGVSHGGRTNGYGAQPARPAGRDPGRAERVRRRPAGHQLVEAHGAGTKLGDPIEITGLSQAFTAASPGRGVGPTQHAATLSSAKSNIGHCEGARGHRRAHQVLLQLQHGRIAPSLHSRQLKPASTSPARRSSSNQEELRDWERPVVDEASAATDRRSLLVRHAGGANP